MRRSIFAILFQAVVFIAVALPSYSQQSMPAAPKMPKYHSRDQNRIDRYPVGLYRSGITGKVRAEFNIDAKGKIKKPRLSVEGPTELGKEVEKILKDFSFDVQPNWLEAGGNTAIYAIEFVYEIDRAGTGCKPAPKPADNEFIIAYCASPIKL